MENHYRNRASLFITPFITPTGALWIIPGKQLELFTLRLISASQNTLHHTAFSAISPVGNAFPSHHQQNTISPCTSTSAKESNTVISFYQISIICSPSIKCYEHFFLLLEVVFCFPHDFPIFITSIIWSRVYLQAKYCILPIALMLSPEVEAWCLVTVFPHSYLLSNSKAFPTKTNKKDLFLL